jgi:outer membrane protein
MYKILITVFLILVFQQGTKAQVQVNAELKQLINQSFGYFPKLKEAENLIVTAEDKMELSRLGANPFVGASAGYSYLAPFLEATKK